MTTPVTFTGTPGAVLPTYDPDWLKVTDGGVVTGDWRLNADGTRAKRGTANANGMAVYKAADSIPTSPNYIVSADWITVNNQNLERVGIMGRASDTTRNGYVLRVTNGSPATVALMIAQGGSPTILVSTTYSNANGTTRRFGLKMDGDQITVIDRANSDAVVLGPVTNTVHAGAGHIGLWFTTDSTSVADAAAGIQIDNLDIEYLAAPYVYASHSEAQASSASQLNTSISMASVATASASAISDLGAAANNIAASGRADFFSISAIATAITLACSAMVGVSSASSLPIPVTTLEANFAGANANASLSSITFPETVAPVAVIRVRSPEDSEWQQCLYRLQGVRGKSLTNQILLTEKEDADSYLGTWQGPWYSFDGVNWINQPAWTQTAGDRVSFSIDAGNNDQVWVATLPPWTQDTVAAWIADLAAAHPNRIKSDLPSHVAHGGAPYVCALSGTGTDENGRQVTNLPLTSFVIRDDSLGVPSQKRWIELWAGIHANEWNGGIQLRGAVNEILNGVHSAALLSRFVFVVRPIMSPKGAYLGFRRNEAAASYLNNLDANREWADGDTSVATVVQWQGILDVDHGVNHADRVVGFFDFHDGKNTSQLAWFYYQPGSPIAAAFAALVQAENAAINSVESSVSGTTASYWQSKGVPFNWTCECADEKSTVAEVEAFGAAYMRALLSADNAGLLPTFTAAAAAVSVESATQLQTAIQLAANASASALSASAILTGSDSAAAAVGSVSAASEIQTAIRLAALPVVGVSSQSELTTAIRLACGSAVSVASATELLTSEFVYASAAALSAMAGSQLETRIELAATAAATARSASAFSGPETVLPVGAVLARIPKDRTFLLVH